LLPIVVLVHIFWSLVTLSGQDAAPNILLHHTLYSSGCLQAIRNANSSLIPSSGRHQKRQRFCFFVGNCAFRISGLSWQWLWRPQRRQRRGRNASMRIRLMEWPTVGQAELAGDGGNDCDVGMLEENWDWRRLGKHHWQHHCWCAQTETRIVDTTRMEAVPAVFDNSFLDLVFLVHTISRRRQSDWWKCWHWRWWWEIPCTIVGRIDETPQQNGGQSFSISLECLSAGVPPAWTLIVKEVCSP
jgi:hypothetical protein